MIQYTIDLFNLLNDIYTTVDYYTEAVGKDITFDCYIINGFCIKLDRLETDTLSNSNLQLLVEAVDEAYCMVVQKAKELGWEIDE